MSGQLPARIDSKNKTLHRRTVDKRDAGYRKVRGEVAGWMDGSAMMVIVHMILDGGSSSRSSSSSSKY